jgi:hypothetical protein
MNVIRDLQMFSLAEKKGDQYFRLFELNWQKMS